MDDEIRACDGDDENRQVCSSSAGASDVRAAHDILSSVALQRKVTGPRRRSTVGGWTEKEDKILIAAVQEYNGRNWKKIAERVPNHNDVQCLHRWKKVLDPDLVKGPWSKEEDDHIIELVSKKGTSNWSEIAKHLPGRIGKQCRERWYNHLKPDIRRTAWTEEEELTLIEAHKVYGNRWAELAKLLDGRTENMIKNHWNCSLRKRVEHQYILNSKVQSRNLEVGNQVDLNSLINEKCKFPRDQRTDIPDAPFRTVLENRGISACDSTSRSSSVDLAQSSYHHGRYDSANPTNTVTGVFLSISKTPLSCPDSPDCSVKCSKFLDLNKYSSNWSFPSSPVEATTPYPYSTPRHVEDISLESCMAEFKSAARSFKNIPSIIRKRKAKMSLGSSCINESGSTCLVREDKDGFKSIGQSVNVTNDVNGIVQYNPKQLFPSPPKSWEYRTPAVESVGRNLENAFNAAASDGC